MTGTRRDNLASALVLGVSLVAGLALLGWFTSEALVRFKALDRSVTVKGLSEREVAADIVIWPIRFSAASNDLGELYASIETSGERIRQFLEERGIAAGDISAGLPSITDKSAQAYEVQDAEYRYTAVQAVTVHSNDVAGVREVMTSLSELGKSGIVFTGNDYGDVADYLYDGLNDIKPAMIEEATREARAVAEKFAADSDSRLGKIRKASQGQFGIEPRDQNNPHLKTVRVVSTVEYYLAD